MSLVISSHFSLDSLEELIRSKEFDKIHVSEVKPLDFSQSGKPFDEKAVKTIYKVHT